MLVAQTRKAHKLHLTLTHYDQFLQRAGKDVQEAADDRKTGEWIGHFTAVHLGTVPVEGTGGPEAVKAAVQMLRAKLAQLYAQQKGGSIKGARGLAGDNVVLSVSSEGLTTTGQLSKELLVCFQQSTVPFLVLLCAFLSDGCYSSALDRHRKSYKSSLLFRAEIGLHQTNFVHVSCVCRKTFGDGEAYRGLRVHCRRR